MVAAERSWSLEVGLGGSCWCRDGASHPQRARAELTQLLAWHARHAGQRGDGWLQPCQHHQGIATWDAALLLQGGSAPAL